MSTEWEGEQRPRQGGLSGCAIAAIVAGCLLVGMCLLFGVGTALLLPAFQAAREAARRNACMNDLKNVGLALQEYQMQYRSFPPAYVADATGKPMHSWRVLILPFMNDPQLTALYQQYKFDEPWDGPNNSLLVHRVKAPYHCPSSEEPNSMTNYVAVVGMQTAWPLDKSVRPSDIKDGISNTIMVVEVAGSTINWMEPRDLSFVEATQGIDPPHTGPRITSRHVGGVNALFADASVRFLDDTTDPQALAEMCTIAGGEPKRP